MHTKSRAAPPLKGSGMMVAEHFLAARIGEIAAIYGVAIR
jgi:hypothetical protein